MAKLDELSTELPDAPVANFGGAAAGAFIGEDGVLLGSLSVDSGTSFTVASPTLPKANYKARLDIAAFKIRSGESEDKKNGGMRKWYSTTPVFIIEDESAIAKLVAAGLELKGEPPAYRVYWKKPIYLDMVETDGGGVTLDWSNGKNTDLRQFMGLTGADKLAASKGIPGCFEGLTFMVSVIQSPYKDDAEIQDPKLRRYRNEVTGVKIIR